MQTAQIVAGQTCVMFLYMLAGFLLSRSGKLTEQGSKDMATVLVWVIIPAVLVNSFRTAFSPEKLLQLAVSGLLAAAALGLSMLLARLAYPRAPLDQFSAAFSNAGFMGIPLVQAVFGPEAVFFLVGFAAMLNTLQWTYGVFLLTGKKSNLSLKNILLNPIMIGVLLGLALFCTGLGDRLPGAVSGALNGLSTLNSPLAMLVLGSYLAKSGIRAMVTNRRLYLLCAVRLVGIPVLTMGLLALLPVDRTIRLAVLIAASAPVGANVAVYAQLHGQDYPYACQSVALSTLFSIVTMPFLMLLSSLLF